MNLYTLNHACGCASLAALVPAVHAAQPLPPGVSAAFDSYTALPAQLVAVLKKAQNIATADSTAPELHQSLTHIYEAREKLHNMPKLTPAQNQMVRAQYGQKMRQAWAELYTEMMRLRNANCFQSVAFAQEFRLMCMMIEK